ncbi:UNVERIFIED_CONTAM: hypothetical protein Sradi_5877200 [Sesamum radiatum]|uniref:Uncharacterized protein n=1 Tax=Sesamum radiatum TaxID=300843 RepID=A0AAW2KRM1_SESRA
MFKLSLCKKWCIWTALMSVTATAKVKISPFVATLAANPTFVSGLCAWAIAQSTKVFLNFCVERKWDFQDYVCLWWNAFFAFCLVHCIDYFCGHLPWGC